MSISLADLRFQWQRALGLFGRGVASLRARGWGPTWARVRRQFERVAPPADANLYFPEDAPFAPFAMPASAEPFASIVIPVYNQASHTLACLRAIAAHPPLAECEVLVIDDGSSDQTQTWMAHVQGVRFHRRPVNGGFIAACNDGAARARGEVLVFLNNDTVPQPGWLDALLDTFDAMPGVGLVGSQLLYPDGRLQESGGVVFADGSAWNYGRFRSPTDPRYASLRDVDYCSGASLAVPRDLFESLGGFDTRYAPAYYEDADLAFAVRDAGLRVLVQPASRVVHLEGISNGTDTASGTKAYQVRNREVFERKWHDALATHAAPGSTPTPATAIRARQVLFVDEAIPRPDRDAGSMRLVALMRMLVADGAHVVLLATERNGDAATVARLRAAGVEVWQPADASSTPRWMSEHGRRFAVVCASRFHVAAKLLPLSRRFAPQARFVLDTVDLHYVRQSRAAVVAGDAAQRRQAERTRRRELEAIAASDLVLVVSGTERELLAADSPGARVEVIPTLHEVVGAGLPFEQRRDLLFVGGFGHAPNVDAMEWFLGAIFPRVRERLPDMVVHCVGDAPPPSLLARDGRDGVRVHGHVPDLTALVEGTRVGLAPLRFGAGVKGKVNLSMAHGQPVVATTCAVEGMHLVDGVDVRVADDAAVFADAIVAIYTDRTLWERLSQNGLENVARHFSAEAARPVVRRVFLEP